MKRIVSITRAFGTEIAKRIPWILLVFGVLLLVQNVDTANHNAQESIKRDNDQKVLLEKIASLSQDNKNLSEDNKKLSNQAITLANRSAKQLDCVKQLFVDYVNTRVFIPKAKADACTVVDGATPSSSQAPESPQKSTPKKQTKSTNTPQTSPQQSPPSIFQGLLKLLGYKE